MEISKQISDSREVTLEVAISADEVTPAFNRMFAAFQREATLPGFRKGKVPLQMIKQRWGRELMSEKAEELARDKLNEALNAEKLEPGGRIDLSLLEYGDGKPLKFKAVFPLLPEVKLSKTDGFKITIDHAEVTDKDIDEQIEALRHKNAAARSIDTPASAGAKITALVQEVDSSGLQLVGRKPETRVFELGMDALGIGADEQLLSVKAGDTRLIRVKPDPGSLTAVPREARIVQPGREVQRQDSSDRTLSVIVEKVEIEALPEVNDEFAKTIDDKINTVDELRQAIRLNLLEFIAVNARRHMEESIMARFLEENPFEVPRAVIESTLFNLAEGMQIKESDRQKFFEQNFADVEHDYRWVRLRDALAEKENITVTDADVDAELTKIAELTGEDADKIKKHYREGDNFDRMKQRMFESRVIHHLLTHAEVEKRNMSLSEFYRVVRERREAEHEHHHEHDHDHEHEHHHHH